MESFLIDKIAMETRSTTLPRAPLPQLQTVAIQEACFVSLAKYPHLLSVLTAPDNSDDRNYNLKDTLAQIQSRMIAGFSSLR